MQVALREGTGRHCLKWDTPQTPKTAKPTLVKLLNFSRKGVSTREKERGRASHERAGGKRAAKATDELRPLGYENKFELHSVSNE